MRKVKICDVEVTAMTVGGNPISGFSHQSKERNREMLDYFTHENTWQFLREAEAAGINTVFARTDDNVHSILKGYWEQGGKIQWFAQVRGEQDDPSSWRGWIDRAGELGASAMYLHGGIVDNLFASERFDVYHEALEQIRGFGVPGGFAGHNPEAHAYIRDNVHPDFQMCCYYNPTDRSKSAEYTDVDEKWCEKDRAAMLELIASLPTPAVHYKVFGGGNKPIDEAFEVMSKSVRAGDVVCIGIFPKDDPDLLAKDVALFDQHVKGV